jgi:E3 ubiquitin-protein ligase HERC3
MPTAMRALLALLVVVCACGSDPKQNPDVDAPPGTIDAPLADADPDATDAMQDAFVPPAGPWAIHTDGRIKCWGGMLGYEVNQFHGDMPNEMGANLPAINLGAGRIAKDITVGTDHACALLDNDRIKCWGSNQYGQLGLGDMTERGRAFGSMGDNLPYVDLGTGRTVKQVSAGNWVTCVILDNNKLKCWGLNGAGSLGYGDMQRRGGAAGQMGDALANVDLGTGRTPKKLFTGDSRVCVLLDNNDLKCWGNNFSGAIGQGQLVTHVGVAPNQMGDNLAPIALGTGLVADRVVHQGESICAVLTTGAIKCWGRGSEGELATGDALNRGDEPNEMGDNLAFAMLGPTNPVALSGAASHGCAVFPSGDVACWGANYKGTLGLGVADNVLVGDMPSEVGAGLARVRLAGPAATIASGGLVTCATLKTGHIQCWGMNMLGTLGIGDTRDRGNDNADMGTALPFVDLGL